MNNSDNDSFYSSRTFQEFFKNSLHSLVLKADTPKFTILAVSNTYLALTYRQRGKLLGKGLFEVFPGSPSDLSEQDSVHSSFMRAIATKTTDTLPVFKYEIQLPETNSYVTEYWTNANEPITDESGNVAYLINTTTNITRQFEAEQAMQANKAALLQLNEELANSNEELATTNEELLSTNDELIAIQHQLQAAFEEIEISNKRFRNMIQSSPVAMLITRGDNMVFEEINEAMLSMIGKDESVKGKPWFEAIPELVGQQPVIDELYHTYRTGQEHKVSAAPILLIKNGQPYHGYYNITYTALIEAGSITGVIQSVVDVTGYITAKNELTKAYEQVRLSKEAAELGTFDMNVETGNMEWDARCRQLFGISHQNEVDFEKDFLDNLHPDDTERVRAVLDRVFVKSASNGIYDVEYRTIGVEDQQLRWVRAKGQVYFGQNDEPLRFIGSVLDITEQKIDDQRKNDFIGMVSHELKTPLTTINGYLQILSAKAKKSGDSSFITIFERANLQIAKMTAMINGFLNVSRLESGKIHLDKQRFDMATLIKETEEETIATISTHRVIFAPVEETFVIADQDKISHVISNLISNAVKYSPSGSTIRVACVTVEGMACVSVQDEGIGIALSDQERLFDRFFRTEKVSSSSISGFGIGLYLAAEIVRRHDGKIWVESAEDKGSTFRFSLPVVS